MGYNPWYWAEIGKFCHLPKINIDEYYLKGLILSFQKIIKSLKLDPRNSSYGGWKSPRAIDYTGDSGYIILVLYSSPSLQVYSYDFDSQSPPVKAYQLVPGATRILLTDSIIFVISHDDDVDPLAVSISKSVHIIIILFWRFLLLFEERGGVVPTVQCVHYTL